MKINANGRAPFYNIPALDEVLWRAWLEEHGITVEPDLKARGIPYGTVPIWVAVIVEWSWVTPTDLYTASIKAQEAAKLLIKKVQQDPELARAIETVNALASEPNEVSYSPAIEAFMLSLLGYQPGTVTLAGAA